MALDWIQNLFQSEQTRGLSGDSAAAVALDDANPYYNYRLRRHKAEGDLVQNPALIWYTSPSVKRRGGLGVHIAAEKGEGVATFTDVLLILSEADYARAMAVSGDPWMARATRSMLQEFDDLCRREGFSRRYAHRQLGWRILCDGSAEMGGQVLGLETGDFVTGLLPNLYTGPVRHSYPVIGIHVNLPGVWDGYKEVGRLYNDEILFTLGSHWLDNFHHPGLREAALYRLQQYPDGSFVHIISPDLQDRYQVTSTDQGGASVLTLATRDGQPLAYVVLAVIDPPADAAPPPSQAGMGRPAPIHTIPPPMLIDDELLPASERRPQQNQGGLGGKTIIPDAPSERIFTLQERGALLQKVHFGNFMEGYDVYLGTRGELGTVVEDKAATFQVRRKRVSLLAHVDGVQVAGYPVGPGVEIPIEGDVVIQVAGQRLEYRDLRNITTEGWPYVGEIRRPASSSYMVWGDQYRVGRSRDCRVVLPDEPRNDNIQWKPSIGDGATIRSKSGDIPKSRFYTDSIMVASEHASVDLRGDEPAILCTARHCYIYVRRQGQIISLYPTESGKLPLDSDLQPGDELLVGNCLFQVGYTPKEQAVAPGPAPKVELSTDDLVSAVSAPDLDELDAPSRPDLTPKPVPTRDLPPVPRGAAPPKPPAREEAPPPPPKKPSAQRPEPDEPASAHGLGTDGIAPKPPVLPPVGIDSILGPAPEFDDDEILPPPTNPKRGVSRPGADAPPPPPKRQEVQLYDDEETEVDLFADSAPKGPASPDQTWDPERWDEELPTQDSADAEEPVPPLRAETPPPPPPRAETPPPPPPRAETPPPPPPRAETPPPPPPRAETPPPPPPRAETPPPPPPRAETPPPPPPRAETPPPPPVRQAPPVVAEAAPPPPVRPVAPPAPEPQPAAASGGLGEVVAVDDAEAQFELGRRMQVVHVGWTLNGQVTCGNHAGADLIVPENRVVEDQPFVAADYFVLKVRGRKGTLELRSPRELLIDGDDPAQEVYDEPEKVTIDVIRRDDQGEEDFAVRLQLRQEPSLPDPRARFLEIDCGDPLAAALFTRGLPTKQARELELGGLRITFFYDGDGVVLSGYLSSYADGQGGFRPFFVQHGEERFQTAPEDGADVRLSAGDRLVAGNAVFAIRKG